MKSRCNHPWCEDASDHLHAPPGWRTLNWHAPFEDRAAQDRVNNLLFAVYAAGIRAAMDHFSHAKT